MKLKYPVVAAFLAVSILSGCGGGGSAGGSTAVVADNPSSFTQTDTVLGTGTQASSSNIVGIRYTFWLYSASATDHKGTQIGSNVSSATPMVFVLGSGAGSGVQGVDQGVVGMKVGGQRTLIIPASMAFGSAGSGQVPANAGLVFDVQLTDVQALTDAPAFSFTDTVVGTGATAAAGTTASVTYSAYLYSASAADHKGILVDTNGTSSSPYAFVLGASQAIPGFDQGVTGMKVGGKRTIIVPSSLAYGAAGSGSVPANSGMVFDVQLVADK